MKKLLLALVVLAGFGLSPYLMAEVDINTASEAELQSLKGVGPAKAKAIVDYRKKNGNFKSVNDLENVDGIGSKTVGALGKDITVSGKANSKAATKPAKPAKPSKSSK